MLVAFPVNGWWAALATRLLVLVLGNRVADPTPAQQPPAPRVAVALVGQDMIGPLTRPADPARTWDSDAVQDGLEFGAVVALALGDHDAQRPPATLAAQVQLGGQPAP
jgi:hypothetical protein